MKKRISSLLAVLMALSMMLGLAGIASAANKNPSITLRVGGFEDDTTGYTQITNVNSNNSSIAKAEQIGSTVRITGVSVGYTTVTYRGFKNNEWDDLTVAVTVSADGTTSSATGSATEVSVALNESASSSLTYENVTNVGAANTGIATAKYDSSSKKIVVTGMSLGSTTISFTYTENGATKNGSLTANVTPAVITPLTLGQTQASHYYELISATSSNTAIVTVTTDSTTAGSHAVTVKGESAGSATVVVKYRDVAGGPEQTKNLNFSVSTTATANATGAPTIVANDSSIKVASSNIPANTTQSGIYFAKKAFTVRVGRNSTLSEKVISFNGKGTKANKLRWVAEDPSILSVTNTGAFKGLKAGKSKLFAVDINGKYLNYVTITVTE